MKRVLPALAILLFAAVSSAQGRKLEFPGFTQTTLDGIHKKIPSLREGTWKASDLDLLIQHLVAVEQYDSARIVKESESVYRVVVGRVRRIAKLDFTGNTAVGESELRQETGLAEKTPFDPGLLVEAGEKIRSLYESLGFPKTQVDLQYTDSQETEVNVSVAVREGPRTQIEDIRLQSANPEIEKSLSRVLRRYRGQPLMERTLAEIRGRARERLSADGFWRTELPDPTVTTNFEETKATVTYKIDRADQYFLETSGNRKILKSTMADHLGLDQYYSANPNIAAEIGSKVKALYLSKGYARADVVADDIEGGRPFTRRIQLEIQEGPLVEIEKFEFSGSFSQGERSYVKFLREHSSPEIKAGHYVKDDLDLGLKNLVTDRWNQGFLRAKIVSTRTVYNKERDKVTILVNFDEGPLTQVESITFEGNANKPTAELLGILGLEQGKPLRLSALDEAILRLKQTYHNQGFLEMQLLNEREGLVSYNEDNTLVRLNFQISEGPQVRVASIVIEGNSLTRDEVILKELEFGKGDILTPQLIEESISRLQRLGHFSTVDIRTLEEKTQIAERTVVVKVTDRDPGLFNFGIGVNNERGLTVRGYTGIAYRNIAGTGRGVSARIDANYNVNDIRYLERKITLGYLEPYLLDTRVRGRLNMVREISVSDFDQRQASEINQTTWSLEQDVTSNVLVIWDVLSIATVNDFYIDGNERFSELDIGSTALTMDLDFRDHPFNPSTGTFTRLTTEYGSPALFSTRTIEYSRSYGSFTHYLGLGRTPGLVWANSVRAGYLRNLSGHEDGAVPYDKKGFLLGGQSTIRGFTPNEAFPNRSDFGLSDERTNFNLKGAASMTLFKSELRFPVWGNIGGALFYDGGQVKIHGENDLSTALENALGWRESVGVSARYVTPVGAVSLEYGWKIRPRSSRSESPSEFHFSIGTF